MNCGDTVTDMSKTDLCEVVEIPNIPHWEISDCPVCNSVFCMHNGLCVDCGNGIELLKTMRHPLTYKKENI